MVADSSAAFEPMRRGDARSGSGAMPVGDARSRAAMNLCGHARPLPRSRLRWVPLLHKAVPVGDTDRRRFMGSGDVPSTASAAGRAVTSIGGGISVHGLRGIQLHIGSS
jgi:hypothetical protein